ncbi:hypothetical protein D3C80_1332090 [compost metagenome]
MLALAHIPGNYHQDRRHGRKRNAGGIRRKQQKNKKNNDAVNHTGEWRSRPAADIRCRSGNRACRRDPSEHRRGNIRDALADQFPVAVMTAAGHSVGHHRRQQRFNRTQHGDNKRRAEQVPDPLPGDHRKVKTRQRVRDIAVSGADGSDFTAEEQRCN